MDAFLQDLRHALRSLRAHPGHALAVVATWTLGLGAAVTVAAVAWGVLWKPLPYEDADRLAIVWETDPHNDSFSEAASGPDLRDFQARARSFAGLAGSIGQPLSLRPPGGEPEQVAVSGVSHDLFGLLGVAPAEGRGFLPEEDRPGAAGVAILGHDLWLRRFGGDRGVLGSVVSLDERPRTVVGVMPAGIDYPGGAEVWVPLETAPGFFRDVRGVHSVVVVGRLAEGVTLEAAQAEMSAIARRLEEEYPEDNVGRGVRLEPLREAVVGEVRPALLVLLGSVALLLAIAGANAAGLILSRGIGRSRELGVRTVLGAGRGRLVRQVLLESLVLALVSGVAGIVLAAGAVRVLRSSEAVALPRIDALGIDLRVAAAGLALAVLVGTVSALAPALRLSRASLGGVLRSGGARAGGSPGSRRTRSALVVGQVALAVILAVGAGLLTRSLWSLLAVDPGFRAEGVLLAQVKLPESRYPAPRSAYPRLPEITGFYDRALERLAAVPGVTAAAAALNSPVDRGWTSRVEVEGYEQPPGPPDEARIRPVSPGYLEAVGIELLRGRALEARDRGDAPPVVLVNRAFADRYFGGLEAGRDPVGRELSFWGTPRRIVGVVADVRFAGLGEPVEPAVYPPLHQTPMGQFVLVLRTGGEPQEMADEVAAAVAEIDPALPLFGVRALDEAVAETLGRPRFQLSLMGVYALLALALAAVGVYGLFAQAVVERSRELGVRMALGADRGGVLRLVLGSAAVLAGAGVALGLVGAALSTRLLASLLHGVRPLDSATYAAVAAILLAAALAAAWLPALRASRVDPVQALREE